MSKQTVAVHGAHGTQGRNIVRALLDAGHAVRALSRRFVEPDNRPSITAVVADLDDPASLERAYRGADAVVVQLPLVFSPKAETQAANVLEALRRAEIPRAVLNAGAPLPPGPIGVPYVDARISLADHLHEVVDLGSTVGPASPYLDNLAAPWSEPGVLEGAVRYPLPGDVPLPWVCLDDVAALIGHLLVAAEPPRRAIVAGPAALTGHEVAEAIGAAVGRPVRWESITPQAFEALLSPHLGAEAAHGVASSYDGPFEAPSPPEPTTIHHGSTTVAQWAAQWAAGRRTSSRVSDPSAVG